MRGISGVGGLQVSFRDPGGCVVHHKGRVLRILAESGLDDLTNYLESTTVARERAAGRAVPVRMLDGNEVAECRAEAEIGRVYDAMGGVGIAEHEPVHFPSYPHEWPAEMLHEAGKLTLALAEGLVDEGLGLKDATPLNVLYQGPRPVFVDALSVERREPGDARWLAYAQFVRTFILPLAVNRDYGIPLDQIFLARRDGLEPEDVYRLLSPWRRLSGAYFGLVTMPRLLGDRRRVRNPELYRRKLDANVERACFVMRGVLRSLRKALDRVGPREGSDSTWSGYMTGNNNYSPVQFEFKEKFVGESLRTTSPARVLDVGCNNGHFSAMAARGGAEVVALDYDPVVVGGVWRMAVAQGLNILPLVVNLTRPSPAVGWRNGECRSFLGRAAGYFDMVTMLAVIHHMIVTERVPLASVLEQAAELTTRRLVIEYVDPKDSMFRRLVRGREALHEGLTEEVFERAAEERFHVEEKAHIPGGERTMYRLRRKE
ncbi:MAG: class I SAM-dependent methyltransferase [Candidatus Solibacter usitatus]|nr:class I SAM-dependent methyltransferase [Candidatus Solibacter usitatus]